MSLAQLSQSFYERSVLDVARELIGCEVMVAGVGGTIVETEAYRGDEPACHAFAGITPRTEPLFGPPGHAYVYISYGIHSMLNFVCEPDGEAAAVLIRAIEPRSGIDAMRKRRGTAAKRSLCSGPGKLAQALGVGLDLNRHPLHSPPFAVCAPTTATGPVVATTRVGISKAVDLPWRFCAAGSAYLSRPPTTTAGL